MVNKLDIENLPQESSLKTSSEPVGESLISRTAGVFQDSLRAGSSRLSSAMRSLSENTTESARTFFEYFNPPSIKAPKEARTMREYGSLLGNFLSKKIVIEKTEEQFFKECIGTKTFEDFLEQTYWDLERSMSITLNEEALTLDPAGKEESKKKIKECILRSLGDEKKSLALASVLQQGVFFSGFSSVLKSCMNETVFVTQGGSEMYEASELEPKIEVVVDQNNEVSLKTFQMCMLSTVNEDGVKIPLDYIYVHTCYRDGFETIRFSR